MRHRKSRNLLNRFTSWRRATVLSLARNVLIHQSIKTTLARAKAAQPLVEKLISLAKDNSLAKKREAFSLLCDHKLVSLLFGEISGRFTKRASGFTRIIRLGKRRGDDAKLAILELTEIKKKEVKKPKKEKEVKPQVEKLPGTVKDAPVEEKKQQEETVVKEKPPLTKKPTKKFLGGLRNIFKKERDSL